MALAGPGRWRGGRRLAAALLAGAACLWAAGLVGSGAHEELLSRALLPLWLPAPGPETAAPPAPPPPPAGAFLLEPGVGACGGRGAPFVLALVASAAGHGRQRAAVRRSWGGARRAAGRAVRTLFVVGQPAAAEGPGAQAALEREARRHGDLIQGRFADTYGNLTRKTLALLAWAAARCPDARFVLKADDDVFVNLPALARHLAALDDGAPAGPRRLYLGRVHWRVPAQRDPAARHHVPAALYPPAAFPPYCSGTAYVLSGAAVAALLAAAPHVPPVPVEDAFVGLCARRAGIAPRHLARFAGAARLPPDPCCYRQLLFSVHGVAPDAMEHAWHDPPDDRDACTALQRALGLLRCRLLAWAAG